MQAYGLGMPGDFIQGIGNPQDSFSNKPLGVYWKDSWRVRPNLTVNYGVRYDIEFPPQFTPPNGLGLAGTTSRPAKRNSDGQEQRSAASWNGVEPRGDGKTVIRASYGIFYDHPLLGLYFLEMRPTDRQRTVRTSRHRILRRALILLT